MTSCNPSLLFFANVSSKAHQDQAYTAQWSAEQCLGEGIRRMMDRSGLGGEMGLWRWANEISKRGVPCQVRVVHFHRSNAGECDLRGMDIEMIRIHFHDHWWNTRGEFFPTLEAMIDAQEGVGTWQRAHWDLFPLGEPAPVGMDDQTRAFQSYPHVHPGPSEREALAASEIDQALLEAFTPDHLIQSGGRRL